MSVSEQNLNVEGLINQVSADLLKSSSETTQANKVSIQKHTQELKDKRQDRIQNLMDQMKGVASGKCVNFVKSIAKVTDFLTAPISALSMGKLNLSLSQAVEGLDEAKKQGKLAGLQINGQKISKVIENLKKFVQDDTQSLQDNDAQINKEAKQLMKILSDIDETYTAANFI